MCKILLRENIHASMIVTVIDEAKIIFIEFLEDKLVFVVFVGVRFSSAGNGTGVNFE